MGNIRALKKKSGECLVERGSFSDCGANTCLIDALKLNIHFLIWRDSSDVLLLPAGLTSNLIQSKRPRALCV
jgi:hypothetical protein